MLVVDDNADVCALFAQILRARGYDVDECVDADVAIAKVKSRDYGAILIEPSPAAGFRPLVEFLASNRSDRLSSVVLATTERDDYFDAVLSESAPFRLLHKPLSPAMLCAAMDECAKHHHPA